MERAGVIEWGAPGIGYPKFINFGQRLGTLRRAGAAVRNTQTAEGRLLLNALKVIVNFLKLRKLVNFN